MKIRVGAAGGKEPYSTLSVLALTIESIVGRMSKIQALQEMGRERGERSRERGDTTRSNLWISEGKSDCASKDRWKHV